MQESILRLKLPWLRFFFYGEIGCFLLSLLHYLPINTNWVSWPQRMLTLGIILCLFQLTKCSPRYQKSAIARSVQLGMTLLSAALGAYLLQQMFASTIFVTPTYLNILSGIIGLIAMAASWIATYQLYFAHGEMLEEKDPALAKKWRILFPISLCVSLLTSFASSLIYLRGSSSLILSVLQTVLGLTGKGIALVSIVYLYRTLHILERKEEYNHGNS